MQNNIKWYIVYDIQHRQASPGIYYQLSHILCNFQLLSQKSFLFWAHLENYMEFYKYYYNVYISFKTLCTDKV